MALNDVTFVKGQGGLGRSLPGKDYISGLVFYTGTLPSGFSSSARIKQVFSVAEAEALGIVDTYSDETLAQAVYTLTNSGATGNTIELVVAEPRGNVSLGVYTTIAGDSTVTLLALSLQAFINAGTPTHGYVSAAPTAGALNVTARPGLGVYLNAGTKLSATIVGTVAGSVTTDFTGGVASLLAIYHYHISEYFRIQPSGNLYLGFYAVPGTLTFSEIETVQNFANGEIRQFGVYVNQTTLTSGMATAAQAIYASMSANHRPASIVIGADIQGIALTALANLSLLTASGVSVTIGQDGSGLGFDLYKAYNKSITNLGTVLGAISLASVSEDIAWLGKFNISDGTQHNIASFANGVLFSATTTAQLTSLNNYKYIFEIKQVDYDGTFFNDSHTCIAFSSDYTYIENVRTIDKAIRNLRAAYLPDLNGSILLNADGTMTSVTLAHFTGLGNLALDQMLRDGEISARETIINPLQNISSTSQLVVAVEIVAVGVARNIKVNIQYVLSI